LIESVAQEEDRNALMSFETLNLRRECVRARGKAKGGADRPGVQRCEVGDAPIDTGYQRRQSEKR
jgi:hypothetical protein